MVASFSAISFFKSESGSFSNTSSALLISSSACFKTSSRLGFLVVDGSGVLVVGSGVGVDGSGVLVVGSGVGVDGSGVLVVGSGLRPIMIGNVRTLSTIPIQNGFSAISFFKSESGSFSNTSLALLISSSVCFKTSSRLSRLNRGFESTICKINCQKKISRETRT
ncbi:hypothetical protein DERF_000394 [Dermatophagoides farinae]|uniref:Uncharacterized protein n=1 Tax=Dermatophagoides farinae TaxID=6954 RepID=A0A922I8H3_DERFA|nr:hypothetical protein DERF_000394 [Dermatophagoides farinae]